MPKSFVRKTFDSWLKANAHRFRFAPVIVLSRKHYFALQFSGLASELFLEIRNYGFVEVIIRDTTGRYWDIIADFDISEERNREGKYYCAYCDDPVLYDSRALLWQEQAFEPMLDWINKVSGDDWICLWSILDDGIFGARRKSGKLDNLPEKYLRCFPLVVEQIIS